MKRLFMTRKYFHFILSINHLKVNLKVNKKLTKNFPKYYREIINTWGSKFPCQTLVPSAISSQFFWFSSQIRIGNKSVFFSSFSGRNINFAEQLFKIDGAVKPWEQLQEDYGLANKLKFKRMQLIHSLPKQVFEWDKICILTYL